MRLLLIALSLALAAPSAAGPLQDAYNAAQAALDEGRYQEAADGFARLLATLPKADAPGNRTAGIMRSRLGAAYLALHQPDLAIPVLERALATLPAATEADRSERVDAQLAYAHALETGLERARAKAAYRDALASAIAAGMEGHVADARIGLGRLSVFDDPATARDQLDAAIPLVEKLLTANRDKVGDIYGLRGRVELNHGDLAAAKMWFERGLKSAGGLGLKVSVYDTRIRSDLGIVTYLQNNREVARKYFAYTGAGHLEGGLTNGADTPLPACGLATGIEPTDIVIIEFSIGADGRVIAPNTVYSSRPGLIEDAFERAVARWSWRPERLAKLPAFWRNAVRLQLACSDTGKRPALSAPFYREIGKWAAAQDIPAAPRAVSDALQITLLREEISRRLALKDSRQTLPIDIALANNALASLPERVAAYQRIIATLAREPNLSDARNVIEMEAETAVADAAAKNFGERTKTLTNTVYPALLTRIEQRGQAVSRGAAFVGTNLAIFLEAAGRQAEAERRFQVVADMPETVLPAADPIRQVALLRLASIAAAQKDMTVARQRLDATGLSPEQCALADVRPAKTGGRVTSADFPPEAAAWGFDGFASVAYDIDTDGKPVNARATIAYPPFVFADGAAKAVRHFRFMPIFRNGTSTGCNGMNQNLNFIARSKAP